MKLKGKKTLQAPEYHRLLTQLWLFLLSQTGFVCSQHHQWVYTGAHREVWNHTEGYFYPRPKRCAVYPGQHGDKNPLFTFFGKGWSLLRPFLWKGYLLFSIYTCFFLKENGVTCLCYVQGEIEYPMSSDLGKGRDPSSLYWRAGFGL